MHIRRGVAAFLMVLAALPAAAQSKKTAALDEAGQSSVYVLREAVEVRPDGSHVRLLRALRHLRDPSLTPLFSHLADRGQAVLKIHGILGLAEINGGRLDLQRVAQVEGAKVQAELLTGAMDSDLLHDEDAQAMLAWSGLEPSVKVILATRLLEHGKFNDTALLHEALKSDSVGRKAMAALLLHQMGDAAGARALNEADAAENGQQRELVRQAVLQTALRHKFNSVATYAYTVAADPAASQRLHLLALRAAMRFGEPHAIAMWRERYESAESVAAKTRLALLALRLSPWMDASLFDPLIRDVDPMVAQIGKAGRAVATKDPRLTAEVVSLILMHHPLANEWALDYAAEVASPEDAQLILLALVRAFEKGPVESKAQRLDHAVTATQVLFEEHPDVATKVLQPILADPKSDRMLVQAILLGLVRSKADASGVVAGLPPLLDPDAESLVLLIRARSGVELNAAAMRDLSVLARGGGALQETLRVQAAWAYLKRTGQAEAALRQVLNPS